MATHDYSIANASGGTVRADINNALAAIVGNNSSAAAPSPTFAYMWWYDTTADALKIRNAANNGWVTLFTFDQTNGLFRIDLDEGADITSAATTDIGAATGNFVTITGTTTITGLGTIKAGAQRWVRFAGALTLTHNATSLILPGGANITTAAGDMMLAISEGSGNWRIGVYQRASGEALVFTPVASQSEMEAAAAVDRIVTPGRLHFHPAVPKFRLNFDGTGTIAIREDYGVTSLTDNGVGNYTINFATNFANTNYSVNTNAGGHGAFASNRASTPSNFAVGSCDVSAFAPNTGTLTDYDLICSVGFGDQ